MALLPPLSPTSPAPSAPPDPSQPQPPDPNAPQTSPDAPIKSYLVLNEERRRWLQEYAHQRIEECRREMGLEYKPAPLASLLATGLGSSHYSSGFGANANTWAWKREANQKWYDGDLAWRKSHYGPSSIFQKSNYTFNIAKRWTRLLAAQLDEDQLSTDPFFAIMPQRVMDASATAEAELAKAIEAYVQREISRSNLRDTLSEARQAALIRNDATVKVSWTRRSSKFTGPAQGVLIHPATTQVGLLPDGSPIMAPNAPLIMPDGQQIEPGQPVQLPSGEYVFAKDDVVQAQTGEFRLRKDPSFVMPQGPAAQYADFEELEQISVDYEGLEAATVFFKDFLFPVRCPALEKADILVHIYDESRAAVQGKYQGLADFEDYSRFLSAEVSRARPEQGEQDFGSSVLESIGIHETYLFCDADGDGQEEWIYLIYDFKNKRIVWCDYLKNHMKEPPFVMIPGVEKVENRAFGAGVYEMANDKAFYADLMFNRVNFSASKEASATFKDEGAIIEEVEGLKFYLGGEEIWTVKNEGRYGPGNAPVYRVNLAEAPQLAIDLMEKVIQAGQLEFGIVTAADGSSSNLNASRTATGIENIERTGNALQNRVADLHASRFRRILAMATDIILEHMPPAVAFFLSDGSSLATLNKEEIRTLDRDIRLLLTKARSAESLQRNDAATKLVLTYLGLPKWQQKVVRSFFVEQLRALDVPDADEKLPDPTPEEIQDEQQQAAQAQGQAAKESISIKLSDLLPSERAQALRNAGIQPASNAELQAAQQQAAAQAQAAAAPNAKPQPAHSQPFHVV